MGMVSSIFILSVVLMAFGMLETDFLLRLSGADEKLLPMAREYMRIILMGVPAAMLSFAMNFCVQAEGRPLFAMGTQVIGAISTQIGRASCRERV